MWPGAYVWSTYMNFLQCVEAEEIMPLETMTLTVIVIVKETERSADSQSKGHSIYSVNDLMNLMLQIC